MNKKFTLLLSMVLLMGCCARRKDNGAGTILTAVQKGCGHLFPQLYRKACCPVIFKLPPTLLPKR